jgi:hypothetical protein
LLPKQQAALGTLKRVSSLRSYHIYFETFETKGIANVLENSVAI